METTGPPNLLGRCVARFPRMVGGILDTSTCSRRGRLRPDGQYWCYQHDPAWALAKARNARRLAAWPNVVAALKATIAVIESHEDDYSLGITTPVLRQAYAALRKAEEAENVNA